MKEKLEDQYESFRDMVIEEYKKGNIVLSSIEGFMTMPILDFIKQPADGILYDLNRDEVTTLTFIKDKKWVNDYAVAKVIRLLKDKLDEKIK